MACNYDETPSERRARNGMAGGDFEASLCGLCTRLESAGVLSSILNDVDWQEAGVDRASFQRWWTLHKERDAERRRYETLEKAAAETEERALLAELKEKYET